MKILLTGLLPSAAKDVCVRLAREGHQVSVMGHIRNPEIFRTADVEVHEDLLGQKRLAAFMDASRFQAIVFFFACQSEDLYEYGSAQGALLDDLFAIQNIAANNNVERFMLVTDRRVFGRTQECREDEIPYPDSPTGVLIKAAEDCLRCSGERILLIRVTSLYAIGDTDSFFAYVDRCARGERVFHMNGSPESVCDFVHADDFGMFIHQALENHLSGVVHLGYGEGCACADIIARIKARLPALKVEYSENARPSGTLKLHNIRTTDWVPRHNYMEELDTLLSASAPKKNRSLPVRIREWARRRLGKALPWAEMILFAPLVWWVSQASTANATFRFIDFWLLYVAIIGTTYGGAMGSIAALVAFGSYLLEWIQAGNQAYLLFYNIDNWLVPVGYMLAGALFGYIHDSQKAKIDLLENEKKNRDAETQFIRTMYDQAYRDRNRLLEQVVSYRDSYGRIYQITRELDTMQPQQVFLSTLDVVEDTLQNHSVSIYACKENRSFARLIIHSRDLKNLPRSLDLDKFPKLRDALNAHRLFVNTALEPGYPAYAAPASDEQDGLAAIMLWDVPFDKQTLYFENLLNVVAGLVQSAMARALKYFNVSGDMYLADTRILNDQAFRSALGVYQNMRRNHTGDYLLVRLKTAGALSQEEMDQRIGRATRATDIVGRLNDGEYYVLFPQASTENLLQISDRFLREKIRCEVISQEVAYG
ncbi:MAG: NAD(P)-dependent oxidoreductase [Eubacteriales bacterium]|nr:NAD(P)-dependent oxidoreductase [Eubacteriales bacterium]